MKPLAFIGMPGSGKTTLSKHIADALRFDCYDSDECIQRKLNLTIPQIFAQFGEPEFRREESDMVAALCAKRDAVLSLGGGAILLNETVICSRCTVVYLERNIQRLYGAMLEQAGTRPLTNTYDDLVRVYNARKAIYERMADITVRNDSTVEKAVEFLLEELSKCGYS